MRREGSEGVFVGEEEPREKSKKRQADEGGRERKLEKSTCVLEKGPSHRLRRRVERASVSGQDEMVDCVWTTSRKYLE